MYCSFPSLQFTSTICALTLLHIPSLDVEPESDSDLDSDALVEDMPPRVEVYRHDGGTSLTLALTLTLTLILSLAVTLSLTPTPTLTPTHSAIPTLAFTLTPTLTPTTYLIFLLPPSDY